jgi:hypothetical protein
MSKKIPITPNEMIRRAQDIPEIMTWSRKKHLIVEGPEFWGIHHIYVADNLKQVVFCLKSDLTTHVFIGIPTHAEEWRRYHENVELHFSKPLEKDALQWAIYKDYVLYRGKMLPPKDIQEEPYWGEVIDVKSWEGEISDEWIITTIKYLYTL